MNKLLSIVILLSTPFAYSMQKVQKGKDTAGNFYPEFTYAAMPKSKGPSYTLTTQSYCVPLFIPHDRDNRFDFGLHPDYQDNTLHQAVRKNNIKFVTELLNSGKYSANTLNGWGETPLFDVQSVIMASLLIHHRAEVNAIEQNHGGTPLGRLCLYDNPERAEIVQLLLAAGADVNALSWTFRTPLSVANAHGAEKIAALLKARGAEDSFETLDCVRRGVSQDPALKSTLSDKRVSEEESSITKRFCSEQKKS